MTIRRINTALIGLLLVAQASAGIFSFSDLTTPKGKTVAASSASYPSGATHYWAFQNDGIDGPGSCDLTISGESYVAGKNNQAIEIGAGCGSAATVSCGLPATTAFSIAFWVKTDSGTASSFSWSMGVAGAVITSEAEQFTVKVGATADSIGATRTGHDVWELIVVTYDGSSAEKISVNGEAFVTGTTTVEGVGGDLTFSTLDGPVQYDEMATWTRALTQQEVTDLYTPVFGP